MRVFAISQGGGLGFFNDLIKELNEITEINMASHYVADRRYVADYKKSNSILVKNGTILNEWDLVSKGKSRKVNSDEIKKWEDKLQVQTLWEAIVADRRMIFGKNCKVTQDYSNQYSLEELQGISITIVEELYNSFEKYKPELVLSFGPATIGCYIGTLVAKSMGIPSFTVKSTKISNYISLSLDNHEVHEHIRRRYREFQSGEVVPKELAEEAQNYLNTCLNEKIIYEGSLIINKDIQWRRAIYSFVKNLPKSIVADVLKLTGLWELDPQLPKSSLMVNWFNTIGKRKRISKCRSLISNKKFTEKELENNKFVFFPLNSEPEIALSVYARYYTNQIEVIRNISQSLPLDTFLVVKDHPRSWGLRSPGYYKKLLEIPNVRFVDVYTPAKNIIRHAQAVSVISSYVGFEAIMQKKPVLTLGFTGYDVLPETMVKRLHSFENYTQEYKNIIENHQFDMHSMYLYIAAVLEKTAPLDLYSVILAKSNRERGTARAGDLERDKQLASFSKHVLERFKEEFKGATF